MNNKNKSLIKYNLANCWYRLFVRFCDLLIVIAILVAIMFLLFNSDINIPGWKILVFSFCVTFSLTIMFIIIPFIFNGYTLFGFFLKIKIHSIYLKKKNLNSWIKNIDFSFLIQLIKRELFLWLLQSIILNIFGFLCLFFPKDASEFIKKILTSKIDIDAISIIGMILVSIVSISFICPIILIVNIILMNKKRALNDYFSNSVVIKNIPIDSDEKSKNLKTKNFISEYGLMPGDISIDDIDESIGEN